MAESIVRVGHLYRLTFPGGKVYIGITVQSVTQRLSAHVRQARSGWRMGAVHHAILKYGRDSIKVETIATAPADQLAALEIAAIAEHRCLVPRGYNVTAGGQGTLGVPMSAARKERLRQTWTGRKHTPEALQRMSESQLARERSAEGKVAQAAAMRRPEVRAKIAAINTGRSQSAETVAKRIAKTTGMKRSQETRDKMRAAQLGKKASAETRAKIGAASAARTHSPESRAKTSAAHKGRVKSEEHRRKLSEAHRGRAHPPMSEETKEKIRAAHKGRAKSPEHVAAVATAKAVNRAAKLSPA